MFEQPNQGTPVEPTAPVEPQEPTAPAEPQGQAVPAEQAKPLDFNEVIFGTQSEQNAEPPAPAERVPQPEEIPPAAPVDNDTKRYQYWQSEADKAKNEVATIQQQNQLLQQQMQYMQQGQQGQPQQPAEEEFPAPPSRPEKPRGFSREEAYTDPTSESARYLDDYEGWRDDMMQYNNLQTQYQAAVIQEQFDNQKKAELQRQQAYRQQQEQRKLISEAEQYVMGNYGATQEQAQDFVKQYSNDQSVTMDNLWKLYTMGEGGPAEVPQAPAPSPAFQQTSKTQQIPSSMGVVSGDSPNAPQSPGEGFMGALINDYNERNPF